MPEFSPLAHFDKSKVRDLLGSYLVPQSLKAMCPRCAGKGFRGFAIDKKAGKSKSSRSKHAFPGRAQPLSPPATPEDKVIVISLQTLTKEPSLWGHLSEFLDSSELFQLQITSWCCFNSLLLLDWKMHYQRQKQIFSEDFSQACLPDEPDVFILMPGIECPSSWRELCFACLYKRKWLRSIASKVSGEASFGLGVLEFLRSASISPALYGNNRTFSLNDVYLVNTSEVSIDHLNAELIEHFLNTTYRSVTCTLSSGTIAIMRECGLPNSNLIVVMCTLYPFQSEHGCVSYADLAEVICHRRLLSGGNPARPRIESFAAAKAEVVMPYEIYGVRLKVRCYFRLNLIVLITQ